MCPFIFLLLEISMLWLDLEPTRSGSYSPCSLERGEVPSRFITSSTITSYQRLPGRPRHLPGREEQVLSAWQMTKLFVRKGSFGEYGGTRRGIKFVLYYFYFFSLHCTCFRLMGHHQCYVWIIVGSGCHTHDYQAAALGHEEDLPINMVILSSCYSSRSTSSKA